MEYKELQDIISTIIVEIDDHIDWGYSEDVRIGLAKIKELMKQITINDNQVKVDKIDLYEYIADCHRSIREFEDALENYRQAINIAEELIDNGEKYKKLDSLFERYIITRYIIDRNTSESLEKEMGKYLDNPSEFRDKIIRRIKQ